MGSRAGFPLRIKHVFKKPRSRGICYKRIASNRLLMLRLSDEKQKGIAKQRGFTVGSLVNPDFVEPSKHKILVVFFGINSGETLKTAVEYLEANGVDKIEGVASIYISKGALHRFPEVVYGYEVKDAQSQLDKVPWITEKNPYL